MSRVSRAGTPLDAMSMDFSLPDSRALGGEVRLRSAQAQDHVHQAGLVSVQQLQRSRRLFQEALIEDHPESGLPSLPRDPAHVRRYRSASHTGPTLMGSPLYNKRPRLMSSIRLAQQSQQAKPWGPYFHHERNKPHPQISQYLESLDSQFVILPPPASAPTSHNAWGRQPGNGGPDLVFIPFSEPQHAFESPPPMPDPGANLHSTKPHADIEITIDVECSEEMPEFLGNGIQSALPQEINNHNLLGDKTKHRKGTRQKKKSWVDDATVTSFHPQCLPEEQLPTATASPPDVNNGQGTTQSKAGTNDFKKQELTLNLRDLQQQKLCLPDLICPSSEDKSREAAVRQWLENTDFPSAVRTLPLY